MDVLTLLASQRGGELLREGELLLLSCCECSVSSFFLPGNRPLCYTAGSQTAPRRGLGEPAATLGSRLSVAALAAVPGGPIRLAQKQRHIPARTKVASLEL